MLEHVNVEIPDQALASNFYLVGCSFTRDPYLFPGTNNMWVNVGKASSTCRPACAGDPRPCRPSCADPRALLDRFGVMQQPLEQQIRVQGAQRLRRGDLPVGQHVPLRRARGTLRQHDLGIPMSNSTFRKAPPRASPTSTRKVSARSPTSRRRRRQGRARQGRPDQELVFRETNGDCQHMTAITSRSMSTISPPHQKLLETQSSDRREQPVSVSLRGHHRSRQRQARCSRSSMRSAA